MEENEELSAILQSAFEKAISMNLEFVTPEWVLIECLKNDNVRNVFNVCGVNIESLGKNLESYVGENIEIVENGDDGNAEPPILSVMFRKILKDAEISALGSERKNYDVFDLIIATLNFKNLYASYSMKKYGLTMIALLETVSDFRRGELEADNFDVSDKELGFDEDDDEFDDDDDEILMENSGGAPEKILSKFTTNLTELARNGEIGDIIGREEELDRTIHILCRKTKNNPVHVGDAGVGKTAIAEGLAKMIVTEKVPERLFGYEIYSLEMSTVLAGTKFRGEFEARLKGIMSALKKKEKVILYIDEIHTIVGAGASGGGNLDASNMLKPLLAEGDVRIMGATTYEEYTRSIEKNRALARRFQKIDIAEPSPSDALKILVGISPKYEEYHGVVYPHKSLKLAVDLSVQYLPDRRLPDKAIDLIDEAGVYVSLLNEKRKSAVKNPKVTENAIKKVTAKMSNVPLENVTEDEKSKLCELESKLGSQIFGQDDAVHAVSLAVKKARAGFRNLDKPEAAFLFVGPTGVGKTELTKVLGELLNENLVRFDMSEYQEEYTVSRLIGSAPGYVGYENGGLLTESVRKNPHSIILFDEIEKAHSSIYNVLLQVLDYGTLTDNQGRKADFRNCIIIFTSNAGARDMEKGLVGFDSGLNDKANDDSALHEAVSKVFSPEFRNRLDEIITFRHLEKNVTCDIVRKAVRKISDRLLSKNVSLNVSPSVVDFVASEGYSKEFGARNIMRTAEKLIATPLVDEVLFGKLCDGGKVEADVEGGKIVFKFEK
ncbi:MAG: ATP-dependent Clp protease ATP-binding subunit [Treponema sp.]|nr:ATP-dependent Clp protease ATP-binding subunit [Treponema sp.]